MYKLNMKILNKMVNGVSTDSVKYYLNGIHVYDKDGKRYYEATDGHVLFRAITYFDGDTLPQDYIIQMQKELKSKITECELVIADSTTAVIKADVKQAFDIIDGSFPEVERVIPKDRELAKEYTAFAIDILKKLEKFYGDSKIISTIPYMADKTAPALWEWTENGVDYTAGAMPMRVVEGGLGD